MKNIITELTNLIKSFNSRLNQSEAGETSKVEERSFKLIRLEKQIEKRIKKSEESLKAS